MPAFTEDDNGNLDWQRLDVFAIVNNFGLAAISDTLRSETLAWLKQHEYRVDQIDCTRGMTGFLKDLGTLFRWEEMFSYKLEDGIGRSLDALNDGFRVAVPSTGGVVLELFRPDLLWQEDRDYLLGVLAIACEHTQHHLACGRRFFTLLVLPDKSPLVGQKIQLASVPYPSNNLIKDPEWRAGFREWVSHVKEDLQKKQNPPA